MSRFYSFVMDLTLNWIKFHILKEVVFLVSLFTLNVSKEDFYFKNYSFYVSDIVVQISHP